MEKFLAESEPDDGGFEEFRRKVLRGKIGQLHAYAERTPGGRQAKVDEAADKAERLGDEVKELNDEIATYAYQACLAFGYWPDKDLHVSERLWLRNELRVAEGADLPMPPVPLRRDRDNAFGETVRETVGIAAPVVLASGTAEDREEAAEAMFDGAMMFTAEDGTWKVVAASEDTTKQILLKVEDWVIVDEKKAAEMVAEAERREAERDEAAMSADDEKHWERMKAWQEECEVLEAEDVFEGETDSGESVVGDGGAVAKRSDCHLSQPTQEKGLRPILMRGKGHRDDKNWRPDR